MRAALALCVGAASLIGAASTARADSGLTFNETKMLPARAETRSDATLNYVISKKDCTDNIDFPFSVTIATPAANQSMEIWFAEGATADCSAYTARYGATAFCKLVHTDAVPTNSNGAYLYTAKAADLAALHSSVTDCDVDDATPLPISLTFLQLKNGDPMAAAVGSANWGKTALRLRAPDPPLISDIKTGEGTITLSFKALDTTTQSYAQEILLFCDPPPGSAAAAGCGCINSGLTSTTTTTTSTTSTTSTTTNTTAPPPPGGGTGGVGGMTGGTGGTGGMTGGTGGMTGGTGGATGGTGGATGGTGGATAGSSGSATGGSTGGSSGSAGSGGECTITEHTVDDCQSCYLAAGQLGLSKTSDYFCGSSTAINGAELTSISLDNGRGYAVAMAILDKVGNVGALSTLECGTPSEVVDFYESYRGRGGTAGGGLCAMRPGMRDPNYLAPAGIGIALALLGGRRAVRRRRAAIDATKQRRTAKDEADR